MRIFKIAFDKKALNIIIELVQKEIQRLAVDANALDIYKISSPLTRKSSERRAELRKLLKELLDAKDQAQAYRQFKLPAPDPDLNQEDPHE